MLLILTDYPYDAVKGGGPAQSLRTLTEELEIKPRFIYGTLDEGIESKLLKWSIPTLIREMTNADIIYANSIFSFRVGIVPLLFAIILRKRIIIAPRGELLSGKLQKKWLKKRIYLTFASWLYSSRFVCMHYTSIQELQESRLFLKNGNDFIATNLVREIWPKSVARKSKRMVWFSRISEEKNLHGAIEIFNLLGADISLDVYGPIEDKRYFNSLQEHFVDAQRLRYCGELRRKEVRDTLENYDILLFPTRAENFGHVIIEAIQSGVYVIVGNNVPFIFDGHKDCGVKLDIMRHSDFVEAIEAYYEKPSLSYSAWRGFLENLYAKQGEDIQRYKDYLL